MTCNLASFGGHKYIIVAIDYFTKWEEAMPTFKADGETTTFFVFNQIIARFGILLCPGSTAFKKHYFIKQYPILFDEMFEFLSAK